MRLAVLTSLLTYRMYRVNQQCKFFSPLKRELFYAIQVLIKPHQHVRMPILDSVKPTSMHFWIGQHKLVWMVTEGSTKIKKIYKEL